MSSPFGPLSTDTTILDRPPSPPQIPTPPPAIGKRSSPAPTITTITTITTTTPRVSEVDKPENPSDSEAETIVLPDRKRRNGERPRARRGRVGSSSDEEEVQDSGDKERSKRLRRNREIDVFSSELSSAPSAPSSPIRESSRGASRPSRNGRLDKEKASRRGTLNRKDHQRRAPASPAPEEEEEEEEDEEQEQEQEEEEEEEDDDDDEDDYAVRSGKAGRPGKKRRNGVGRNGAGGLPNEGDLVVGSQRSDKVRRLVGSSSPRKRKMTSEHPDDLFRPSPSNGSTTNASTHAQTISLENQQKRRDRLKRPATIQSSPVSASPSPPPPSSRSVQTTNSRPERSTGHTRAKSVQTIASNGSSKSTALTSSNSTNSHNHPVPSSANKPTLRDRTRRPRPLSTNRDTRSSSEEPSPASSRQGSPNGLIRIVSRNINNRTPGSPVSMVNLPHKPKRDATGRTLLHRAAQRGSLEEVINIYNQHKSLLNAEDNAGYIPLHEAALNGHVKVVKFLLDSGSWIDVQSQAEKDTPLMDAVENGHLDVVRLLLEAGADPKLRNKAGANALECINEDTSDAEAIEVSLKSAIKKQRNNRHHDDENRNSAAIESQSSRDPSVASPVHDTAPISSNSRGAGAGRRRNARAEQTKNEMLWLEGGKNGMTKLRERAKLGDTATVYACLNMGLVPDVETLIGAIKGGHTDTVSILIACGAPADPDPPNNSSAGRSKGFETPMLAAIGRDNIEMVKLLASHVNPLRKDSKGRSYVDIARERAGDIWEEEVQVLQAAWDKALQKGTAPPPESKRTVKDSASQKKVTDGGTSSKRKRSPKRDASGQGKRPASSHGRQHELPESDNESADITSKNRKTEPDSSTSTAVKKKRRLVSGKEYYPADKSIIIAQEPTEDARVKTRKEQDKKETQPHDDDDDDEEKHSASRMESGKPKNDLKDKESAVTKEESIKKDQSGDRMPQSKSKEQKPAKPAAKPKESELQSRKSKDTDSMINKIKEARKDQLPEKSTDHRSTVTVSMTEKPAEKTDGNSSSKVKAAVRTEAQPETSKRLEDFEKTKQEADRIARLAKKRKKEQDERDAKLEAERDRRRSAHLFAEQKSIMDKASMESKRCRRDEEHQRRKVEEAENARKIVEQKKVEQAKQHAEALRQEEEEHQRQKAEEDLRQKLLAQETQRRIEEEARNKAAEEEECKARAKIEHERLALEASQREMRQMELELARRETLPYPVKLAAENPRLPHYEQAKGWLPLYSYSGNVNPNKDNVEPVDASAYGTWLCSLQVAMLLATNDLSLSEFKLDEKRPITPHHRFRFTDNVFPMFMEPSTFDTSDIILKEMVVRAKQKLMNLEPMFWVKFEDFQRIIEADERFKHLRNPVVLRMTKLNLDCEYIHP